MWYLLITHVISSDYPFGIFWLPMWYLQMKTVWRPLLSYIVKYRHIRICIATKIAVWRPTMSFLCHLISGEFNATRCVYLANLEYITPKYVKSVINKPEESSCGIWSWVLPSSQCAIRKQYLRFLTPSLWIQRTMK
jgi:hypothetical protein